MKIILKNLNSIIFVTLGLFFLWHIFNGKLGLIAGNRLKNETKTLLKQQQQLQHKQITLKNEINNIKKNINEDYLETIALKFFFKIPKNALIIKLSQS